MMHNEVIALKNKLNSQMFFKKDWFNNLLIGLNATQTNTNIKQGDYVKVKKITYVVLGFKNNQVFIIPLDTSLAISYNFWFPEPISKIKLSKIN
jgi:hypothetical protein